MKVSQAAVQESEVRFVKYKMADPICNQKILISIEIDSPKSKTRQILAKPGSLLSR